jgi:hypothetical protein
VTPCAEAVIAEPREQGQRLFVPAELEEGVGTLQGHGGDNERPAASSRAERGGKGYAATMPLPMHSIVPRL